MAQGMADYQQAIADYAAKGNQQYTSAGDLADSGMANIKTDPRYAAHEQAALADLEQISKDGMSARDLADLARNDSRVNRQAAGRQGAIRQNMAARGMSGSGMDLVAQMQSSQDATENQALASMEKNAQAQEGRRQAISQRGQLSGQLSARDFQQQAMQAQAQDSINRFNQANRQQVMNNNTQGANQFAGNVMQAQQGGAQMRYNSGTEQANRQIANKPKSAWDTAKDVIGMAGSAANIYSAFNTPKQPQQPLYAAHGMPRVPGPVFGPENNPANDTVPAMLSPGEAVVPKTELGLFDRIDEPTVREYLKSKYGSEADMQQARDNEKLTKVNAGIAGLNDTIANANRDPKVYHNSMQNLGQAPKITQNELQKTDMSGAVNAATKSRQDLEGNRDEAIKAAFAERKSQLAAQVTAKQAASDEAWKTKEFGQKGESIKATQDLASATLAGTKVQRGIDNGFKERELKIKEGAANGAGGGKTLPSDTVAKMAGYDAASSIIDQLEKDYTDKSSSTGSWLKSKVSGTDANTYKSGLKPTIQSLGTALEGGKLTDADFDKYADMIPGPGDFPDQAAAKIASLRANLKAKREAEANALTGAGYKVPATTKAKQTTSGGVNVLSSADELP
jgi:hypothetical protein